MSYNLPYNDQLIAYNVAPDTSGTPSLPPSSPPYSRCPPSAQQIYRRRLTRDAEINEFPDTDLSKH